MGQPRADPSPNLTITHTPGSWVLGESKCVAVDLFSFHYFFPCCTVMLSSILHIKKSPRDSYEFGLKTLSLYLL